MKYPTFFDRVPTITLYDPLAELLGAVENGIITYTYLDAVKLAGHSCPTVAGAYLMALKGIDALYPDSVPQRGDISVTIKGSREEGTNGVIGNVLGLITGAAAEEGFKGLKGNHARNGLLRFQQSSFVHVMMTRKGTRKTIYLNYNPSTTHQTSIPPQLMQAVANGTGSAEEKRTFAHLWQQNVAAILTNHTDPNLIIIQHEEGAVYA